jgi:dTDP-4-dehydrorhamnose 3,5-epimerase-like enzyme
MSVKIFPINLKASDERGALHYFSTDRTGEFLLVYRNAGSVSGQHYHKGNSGGKNPEDMLLVQGKANLHWKDLKTNQEETVEIVAPSRVFIQANVWHELTAITDIVFVELNSLADGSEDTYRL